MTNSQAAEYDSWLVRCFPCAPGFSQSNQHNYIQGSGRIILGREEIKEGGGDYLKRGGINTLCELWFLLRFLMNVLSHFPNVIFPSEAFSYAINYLLKEAFTKL